MNTKTFNVFIKDKIITAEDNYVIICDNSNYQIKFTFDAEWKEHLIKTARFIYLKDKEQKIVDVVFDSDTCNIPIISNAKYLKVGVFAGNLHTTTSLIIKCDKSILGEDGTPEVPQEDVYNRIIEKCNDAISIAQSVEDRANRGEFKGEKGDKGSKGDRGEQGLKGEKGDTPDLINYYTKSEVDVKICDLQEFVNDMNHDVANLYNTIGDIETLLGGI